MTASALAGIQNRLQAVKRQYHQHYAGQARITRDPKLIKALIEEIDEAMETAKNLPKDAGDVDELQAALEQQRALLSAEEDAIEKARAGGPLAWEAHQIQTWHGILGARYQRFFAGKSRLSRDLPMLQEMVEESTRLLGRAHAVTSRTEVWEKIREDLANQITLYRDEIAKIIEARGEAEVDSLAGAMGTLANQQFALYKQHFADRARRSRRLGLIRRMVTNLEHISQVMKALEAKGAPSSNTKNREVVGQRLERWHKETHAIEHALSEVAIGDLVTELGESANAIFDQYRENFAGLPRATREPGKLSTLCDELFEVLLQMRSLDEVGTLPNHRKNLLVVINHLANYERELRAIQSAHHHQPH